MMKKVVVIYIFTIISFASAFAQGSIKKADNAFEKKNYSLANELYQKTLTETKDKKLMSYIYFQVAECYRYGNKYLQANEWYKKAVTARYNDLTKTMYFNYGNMLMMAGDYKQAKKMYKSHLLKSPKDEYAKLKMKSCDFADTAKTLDDVYEVRNVQELNSKFNDFAPSVCKDKIIFASARFSKDSTVYTYTGDGFEDLYETYLNSSSNIWMPPTKLQGINTKYNDGTFSFDPNRNIAYIMQCNGKKGVEKNCNIYTSEYNESANTWTAPKKFQYSSSSYSSGHPTISPDGNTLYFSSNNPTGLGGTDIWMTKRNLETNKWDNPINIGKPINTPFNEMFPYQFDDKGLYVASDGHLGFGGLDIFYAEKKDSVYAKPQNLKTPFNSSADDFGFVLMANNSGFFTSNRPGGVGDDDLYFYGFRKVEIVASGRVVNKDTYMPVPDAIVVITNLLSGVADTLVTDSVGIYTYPFMEPDMDYEILTFKSDYLNPEKKMVTTLGIKQNTFMDSLHGYDINFILNRIEEGKEYEIRDIYYDLDKYDLRPLSVQELENVINIMNNNPEVCIQLNSHTDERATDEYNIELSNNRAKSVVDYLVSKGIDSKRLSWQGWGETKMVYPHAQNEDEHQANRRTTFTIVNIEELNLGEKAHFEKKTVDRVESAKGNAEPVVEGVCFRIQLAASRSILHAKTFENVTKAFPSIETYNSKHPDGYYKFTLGQFNTLLEAENMKAKIDELGYNSYIVAYSNGVRISINDAVRLMNKKK